MFKCLANSFNSFKFIILLLIMNFKIDEDKLYTKS